MKKFTLLVLISALLSACTVEKEVVIEESYYKCKANREAYGQDTHYKKSDTDYFFKLSKIKSSKSPEGFYWTFGYTYDTQAINAPVIWISGSKRTDALTYQERIGEPTYPDRQTEYHKFDIFNSTEIIGTMIRHVYKNNKESYVRVKTIGLNKLDGKFFIQNMTKDIDDKDKTTYSNMHIVGGDCKQVKL